MNAVLCKVTLGGPKATLRGVGVERQQTSGSGAPRPISCPPPATSSAPPAMRYSYIAPRRRKTLSLPAPMPTERQGEVWLDELDLVDDAL
jgi:hypothetical protein